MASGIKSALPLKPAVFHILLAFLAKPRHGYGAMRAVEEDSGQCLSMTTGAFYRHLAKLLERGWVEEVSFRPADDDPRRGAYYSLTRAGKEVLAAESERMAALVRVSAAAGLINPGR